MLQKWIKESWEDLSGHLELLPGVESYLGTFLVPFPEWDSKALLTDVIIIILKRF